MSLEAAINENTLAIYHLISFLQNAQVPVADNGTSGNQQTVGGTETSPSETAGETAVNSEPSQETDPTVETAPVAVTVETVETVMVDDVVALKTKAGKALTKISQTQGKEVAYKILSDLGYEKFTQVKIEDYTKIIELCEAA